MTVSAKRWTDRRVVPLLLAWLAGLFLATLNPWWVPTGDSEVYLVVARNLLRGDGLMYLGERVAFVPPGWSATLALLLWLGASILWLKVFQIACMTGGLLLCYGALRQVESPVRSGLAVGLAAICSPLYPLTFWLHTDALFVLIASAATFGALRWQPGRGRSLALLAIVLFLVAAGIAVRWAGLVYLVVVAGAILGAPQRQTGDGQERRRRYLDPRRLLAAITVFLVAGGAFVLLKLLLGGGGGGGGLMLATIEEAQVPSLLIRERPNLSLPVEFAYRLVQLPSWFGWTLFVPLRFVSTFGRVGWLLDLGVGGLALALLAYAAWMQGRRGRLLYAGTLLYVVGLCLAWPHVNNRYLVPVLPFVIAGVLSGLGRLIASKRWRLGPLWRGLRWAFVAAILATNGSMWLVDVWVARAPTALDFYARYEAGVHLSLMEAAAELDRLPDARDGNVGVSERYENLRERWEYKTAQRVIVYLVDLQAIPAPRDRTGWGVKPIQQWSRDNDLRYYVHQNPTVPGRLWHFRLTREEHGRIMGDLPGPVERQFELYEMVNHPTQAMPDRRWLERHPSPPLFGERLETLSRNVPHLDAP